MASNDLQNLSGENLSPRTVNADGLQALAVAVSNLANAITGLLTGSPLPPSLSTPTRPPTPKPTLMDRLTVGEAIGQFLRMKARMQRSDRYLRSLRVSLSSFGKGRMNKPLEDVTLQEIEAWLEGQAWSPRTQKGYLADVRTLFNFALKRGYVTRNPATAVELPPLDEPPLRIHTPEEVKTTLQFARGYNLNLCRALAVRYFAGLRSAEVDRLSETDIKAEFIEVTASKAKTRRRRLVPIRPNLRSWLDLGGVLPLHDLNNRWRFFTADLRAKHGIEWPCNVTRHSFVSYHLAKFKKANETALEAGHTEQMTFAVYREVVTPQSAEQFWEIKP